MFELEFLGWLLIILTLPINICIWFKNYISERKFYIYKKIEIGMFFFVFLYILGLFLIWQSSNGGSYLYLIFILVILTIISTIIFVFPLLGYIRRKNKYLFNWNEIPGKDEKKLIDFLNDDYKNRTQWVKKAVIEKNDRKDNIKISTEFNNIKLRLDDEKTMVIMEFDDETKQRFKVKTEQGKIKIYKKQIPKKIYSLISFIPIIIIGVIISSLYHNTLWIMSSAIYLSCVLIGYFYLRYYSDSDIYFSNTEPKFLYLFIGLIILPCGITLNGNMLYWLYSSFFQVNAVLFSIVIMFGIFILNQQCRYDLKKPLKGFSLLFGINLILNIFAITYTSKLSNNEFFHLSIPILTQYNGTNPYLFQNILLIFILTISIFIGSLFYICNLMFDLIEYVENNDACLK